MVSSPVLAIHFSERGEERVFWANASRDVNDGPGAARSLVRAFCRGVGRAAPGDGEASARLHVLPPRSGGPQLEVAPVLGQSLAGFLEEKCREDNGAFQLRAEFDGASAEDCVLVRVAFPGTAPTAPSGVANTGGDTAMLVEQFECKASHSVSLLKAMIQARTGFPMSHGILLLGCKKITNELTMDRVAAAATAAGTPLQVHIATAGAYVFLRREGQGHRVPSGPCTLTLQLSRGLQGTLVRPMAFDPVQHLEDLRLSVQAVLGLPPAGLTFRLAAPDARPLVQADDSKSLEALGFVDGCTVDVETWPVLTGSSPLIVDAALQSHDIPLDVPTEGSASVLHDQAAAALSIIEPSRLALFAGGMAISRDENLSCLPLADGAVLSACVSWSLQLSFSVLVCRGTVGNSSASASTPALSAGQSAPALQSSGTASPGNAAVIDSASAGGLPATVACLSVDTIAEVRQRAIDAAARTEEATRLRGSKVFAVDRSVWTASGGECSSLGTLAQVLGHFVSCSDSARLSRLGIADGQAHLVFVPESHLLIEVQVHVKGESVAVRKLRGVPSTCRIAELTGLLERSLEEQPPSDRPTWKGCPCQWALATQASKTSAAQSPALADDETYSPVMSSPARGVAAMMFGSSKRKSLGAGGGADCGAGTPTKRRRSMGSSAPAQRIDELSGDAFVGDLHAQHHQPRELPNQFLCPISKDIMLDPVIVSGSGNTYDRESIERHFQYKFTDPISNMELRHRADRKLVPNNSLRSQVDEAVRAQVDLRLAAYFGDPPRGMCSGDAPLTRSLCWFSSLLSGSSSACS
mmetsp:Transcript_95450/g.165786  ORF Transcript_95450/g.165786 Transcript_95450/m.165786 type:complete len:809 (-) Transcript_95450:56-2482(-)